MALLDPLYRRRAGHHLIRMAKVKKSSGGNRIRLHFPSSGKWNYYHEVLILVCADNNAFVIVAWKFCSPSGPAGINTMVELSEPPTTRSMSVQLVKSNRKLAPTSSRFVPCFTFVIASSHPSAIAERSCATPTPSSRFASASACAWRTFRMYSHRPELDL